MRTCERHDDSVVVYDSRECPVCRSEDEHRAEIKELRYALEAEISNREALEARIDTEDR